MPFDPTPALRARQTVRNSTWGEKIGIAVLVCILVGAGLLWLNQKSDEAHRAAAAAAHEEQQAQQARAAAIQAALAKHQVLIGMSAAQVRQAWGAPQQVLRRVSATDASEQWAYGDTVLSFEHGILQSMQYSSQ